MTGLRRAMFLDPAGPLWMRELARASEEDYRLKLARMLAKLDADRIVIGHSVTDSRRIETRFGGRVVRLDTGAGPTYDGRPSALVLAGGKATAVYLDGEHSLDAGTGPDESQLDPAKADDDNDEDDEQRFDAG